MPQLDYSYKTKKGVAGGIMDIAPYAINSRINGETIADALMFGMGAVRGATPGVHVIVPDDTSTADLFEGLIVANFTNQMDMAGAVLIMPGQTVGLMQYGYAWARIAEDVTPMYGDILYLIIDGDEAGLFTNVAGTPGDPGDPGATPPIPPTFPTAATIAIKGRFIGNADGGIAPVELFNQAQLP